jgi:hypothetical protein
VPIGTLVLPSGRAAWGLLAPLVRSRHHLRKRSRRTT